jgi:hypothetical protein
MTRSVFLYILFIALLITGCSASTPEPLKSTPELPRSNLPSLDGTWKIKMTHSGGIMGLLRSIEISSDGKFTVMDERASKTVTGELTADELSKLKEQVASSEYIPASKPDGMGCADCFIYDLEIQGSGEKSNIQLNDINLPTSGLGTLVTYLRGLIETTLK